MRKLLIGLLATLALLGGTSLISAPADAATATATATNRVSRAEFRAVQGSWTKAHVHRVFDTNGRFQYEGYGNLTRTYKGWTNDIEVQITYVRKNGHWVVGKDQWGTWKYAYDLGSIGHD